MTHPVAKWSIAVLSLLVICGLLGNAASAQAALSIGLSVSPTSETDVNGRLTYTAVVSNTGTAVASAVKLTFTMPYFYLPISAKPSSCVYSLNGPLYATCNLGDIAPNATATAIAVVYPTNVGNLFVNADAVDGANDTATAQTGSTLTGVGIADVLVQLDATPNPSKVGSPLTYSLTAYNIGDDDARSVVVDLVLPPGVTYGGASTGCTLTGSVVECSAGHLVVSGSKTFHVKIKPVKSGWMFATGLLRGASVADPSATNDSATSRIWVNP